MPRERVQWFKKESIHDSDNIHARQSCTYHSIVNVNKNNYPYLSSFEQKQTWTVTRTMSNNLKKYQSSIDNIHLTMPVSFLKPKQRNYENISIEKNSFLPLTHNSLTSLNNNKSIIQPVQKIVPRETIPNFNNLVSNKNFNMEKSPTLNKLMRIIHMDGKFVVRI